ncbi:MAG: T9SS type A sorting domain-containing protein [Bacteroidota bacterium]
MKSLMHSLLPILLTLTLSGQNLDPTVVATAGDIFSNGQISFAWTLGEPMTESLSSSTTLLTQGFHQPVLEVISSANNRSGVEDDGIHLFPNPAATWLQIELPPGARIIRLLDLSGRIIDQSFATATGNSRINVAHLPAGVYLLQAQLGNGQPISKRFIKR